MRHHTVVPIHKVYKTKKKKANLVHVIPLIFVIDILVLNVLLTIIYENLVYIYIITVSPKEHP